MKSGGKDDVVDLVAFDVASAGLGGNWGICWASTFTGTRDVMNPVDFVAVGCCEPVLWEMFVAGRGAVTDDADREGPNFDATSADLSINLLYSYLAAL